MLFKPEPMKKETLRLILIMLLIILSLTCCRFFHGVDRLKQVSRYNITKSLADTLKQVAVGNNEFYFTTDITGLQTLSSGINQGSKTLRQKSYYKGYSLPEIGLMIVKEDNTEISYADLQDPSQMLDLWNGIIESRFKAGAVMVNLKTVCHPDYNMISVRIASEMLIDRRLKIKVSFPDGNTISSGGISGLRRNPMPEIVSDSQNIVLISNHLLHPEYYVQLWKNSAVLTTDGKYTFYLNPLKPDSVFSFSIQFLDNLADGRVQNFGETMAASKKSWNSFWNSLGEGFFISPSTCSRPDCESTIQSAYFRRILKDH